MRLSGAVGPRTSSRPLFKRFPALAKLPHEGGGLLVAAHVQPPVARGDALKM